MPFNLPCAQQHTNSQWKQENITPRLPNYVRCMKSRRRDHNAHACSQQNASFLFVRQKLFMRKLFFKPKTLEKSPPTNYCRLQALKIMTQYILTLAWLEDLAVHLVPQGAILNVKRIFFKINCRKVGGHWKRIMPRTQNWSFFTVILSLATRQNVPINIEEWAYALRMRIYRLREAYKRWFTILCCFTGMTMGKPMDEHSGAYYVKAPVGILYATAPTVFALRYLPLTCH